MKYIEHRLKQSVGALLPEIQRAIIKHNSYLGVPIWKCPMDLQIIQEVIFEKRPLTIVELGTKYGGFTLYMAKLLDAIGNHAQIISVDVDHSIVAPQVRALERVRLIERPALKALSSVADLALAPVMVLEDTSHEEEHTFKCLEAYSPLVSIGQYFICEDSVINHGLPRRHSGPYPAIERFLAKHPNFISQRSCERFVITWNPLGYLKRIA